MNQHSMQQCVRAIAAFMQSTWGRVSTSLILLAFVLRTISFRTTEVVSTLSQVHLVWLGLVLVVKVFSVYFSAWRQQIVFRADGLEVRLTGLFRVLMVSEALNRVTPGNLAAMAYVTVHAGGTKRAMGLVLVDKVLYLAMVLLAAGLSALWVGYVFIGAMLIVAVLAIIALGMGTGRLMSRFAFASSARSWLACVLRVFIARRRLLFSYLATTGLGIGCGVMGFWLIMRSVGESIQIGVATACATLTTAAVAVPITINGLGLREWIFYSFLGKEFTGSRLISYLLLFYLVNMGNSILGALMALSKLPRSNTHA